MAFSAEWGGRSGRNDHRWSSRRRQPAQRKFAGAALAGVALACVWTLWSNLAGTSNGRVLAVAAPTAIASDSEARRAIVAAAYAKLADAVNSYRAHFDPRFLGSPPGKFAKVAVLVADAAPTAAAPALELSVPQTHNAALRDTVHAGATIADASPHKSTIFDKLFGKPSAKPSQLMLAYAAADDGLNGGERVTSGRYDRSTAVYDISAHTVYLPDGTELEAHSGYAEKMDDPRYTDEKMRGATPATIYDLQPRESLFHGIQALRLIPEDEAKVFGRTGLLAHTFMLGRNGQSNGCVSFRDYNAFLHAYLSGEIKRLAVVARLD
jgi:Protein of unknown function (DUF2778)